MTWTDSSHNFSDLLLLYCEGHNIACACHTLQLRIDQKLLLPPSVELDNNNYIISNNNMEIQCRNRHVCDLKSLDMYRFLLNHKSTLLVITLCLCSCCELGNWLSFILIAIDTFSVI